MEVIVLIDWVQALPVVGTTLTMLRTSAPSRCPTAPTPWAPGTSPSSPTTTFSTPEPCRTARGSATTWVDPSWSFTFHSYSKIYWVYWHIPTILSGPYQQYTEIQSVSCDHVLCRREHSTAAVSPRKVTVAISGTKRTLQIMKKKLKLFHLTTKYFPPQRWRQHHPARLAPAGWAGRHLQRKSLHSK